MGKRIIPIAIFVLLIVLIAAAVTLGAVHLFQVDYQTLSASQEKSIDGPTPTPDLTAQKVPEEAPAEAPADPVVTEDAQGQESFGTVAEPAPETSLPVSAGAGTSTLEAKNIVSGMTLEEKICQMLFVTQESLTGYNLVMQSGAATQSAYNSYPVGGIIYFAGNLVSTDQTKEMIANIQDFAKERIGLGLFIGVDEEGGSVARLAENLGTTQFEDMAVYGEEGDAQAAYNVGAIIAGDMKALGFNVDFAPVADVLTNRDNTAIGKRSFGSNPDLVADFVAREVQGFVEGGVLCSPKHFPGQGSTGSDTHNGYAATEVTMEELDQTDLKPFRSAIEAGAPMIMVGHMTLTSIDEEHPASLSPAIVDGILRQQLGYDGIVITDAMNMSAITNQYGSGEAAVQAVTAGCDMILCPTNISNVIYALTQAVEDGTLSEERIDQSVTRIVAAKIQYGIS